MFVNTSGRGRCGGRGVAIGRPCGADILMVAVQVQLPLHLDGKMFQGPQSKRFKDSLFQRLIGKDPLYCHNVLLPAKLTPYLLLKTPPDNKKVPF